MLHHAGHASLKSRRLIKLIIGLIKMAKVIAIFGSCMIELCSDVHARHWLQVCIITHRPILLILEPIELVKVQFFAENLLHLFLYLNNLVLKLNKHSFAWLALHR